MCEFVLEEEGWGIDLLINWTLLKIIPTLNATENWPSLLIFSVRFYDVLLMAQSNTGTSSDDALEIPQSCTKSLSHDIGGLVQERRNSIADALELHLSRTNTSI